MMWTPTTEGLEVYSTYLGPTIPLRDLYAAIHSRGWEVTSVKHGPNGWEAEAKNPADGRKVKKVAPTQESAVQHLLLGLSHVDFIRTHTARQKLGMWGTTFTDKLKEIADAYAKAPAYDPKAVGAFMELAQDSMRRAETLKGQLHIEVVDDPEPYANAQEMCKDIHNNKHFLVSRANCDHPVWSVDQIVAFRIVHDILGHCASGGDFGWQGENLACAAHFPLLSPTAQKALFSECIGQTAYAIYYRGFGPQKVVLIGDLIEEAMEQENAPGHQGVHPSQALAPVETPQVPPSQPGDEVSPFPQGAGYQIGPHVVQQAMPLDAEYAPKPEHVFGAVAEEFFDATAQGANAPARVPGEDARLAPYFDHFNRFKSHFDNHIETSIPTYRASQAAKTNAILGTYPQADVLDIASSTGAFGKTLSSMSGGHIRTVNLDPNAEMHRAFEQTPTPGAVHVPQAFGASYVDNHGVTIPKYEPGNRFDVVHESMGFQFMGPDRDAHIAEAKRLMRPGGVFLTEQKLMNDDWQHHEAVKDVWKSRFYSPDQLAEKNRQVGFQPVTAASMMDNVLHQDDLEAMLRRHFRAVVQYWSSGNFKGYAASDDPEHLNEFVSNIRIPQTRFNAEQTPRPVQSPSPERTAGMTRTKLLEQAQRHERELGPDRSLRVHEFPDGWSIREIQSYGDMEREGQLMHNCFSHDRYETDDAFMHRLWKEHPFMVAAHESPDGREVHHDGDCTCEEDPEHEWHEWGEHPSREGGYAFDLPEPLYSLRDPDNLPHVSIDPGGMDVALGRNNHFPKPEYSNYLHQWRQDDEMGIASGIPALPTERVPTEQERNDAGYEQTQRSLALRRQLQGSFHKNAGTVDPNQGWESGVEPLIGPNGQPSNVAENDPLGIHRPNAKGVTALDVATNLARIDHENPNARWFDRGEDGQHVLSRPEMKRAVVNAFACVLLSPQKDLRWNTIHYQDLADIVHTTDDPNVLHRRLEQRRLEWNRTRKISPLAHKPYYREQQDLARWLKAKTPGMTDEAAHAEAAGQVRTLLEQEKVRLRDELAVAEANKPVEKRTTTSQIEIKAGYEVQKILQRIMAPVHDPETDFGEQGSLFATAAAGDHGPGQMSIQAPQDAGLDPSIVQMFDGSINPEAMGAYGAWMNEHLKSIAQVSRHADAILDVAIRDVEEHDGAGHNFRAFVLSLGISGVGPKVTSFAWLLLTPELSQLATIDTHMLEVLGYKPDQSPSPRDYFKMERQFRGRLDAAGYNDLPLGLGQWAMWDYKRTGRDSHQDHAGLRPINYVQHENIDWHAKPPKGKGSRWKGDPWWRETEGIGDQIGQHFDETIGTQFRHDQVPFQDNPAYVTAASTTEFHVAWAVPPDVRAKISNWVTMLEWPEGHELDDPAEYHITVAYAKGGWKDEDQHALVKQFTSTDLPFESTGLELFGPNKDCVVLRLASDVASKWANRIMDALDDNGLKVNRYDGYKAHITVGRASSLPKGDDLPMSFRAGKLYISTPRAISKRDVEHPVFAALSDPAPSITHPDGEGDVGAPGETIMQYLRGQQGMTTEQAWEYEGSVSKIGP